MVEPSAGYDFIIEGQVLTTQYYGDVSAETIIQVIEKWSEYKQRLNELTIFVFDYSQARMRSVASNDAVGIANEPIFASDLLNDIYIIGILKEPRDYALSCLWATWLVKSNTFPRENVFLFRSKKRAEAKIKSLVQQLELKSVS
ncbi:MAG: hypothetical protein ACFHVJ_11510 [Aestuariibacter sp.]